MSRVIYTRGCIVHIALKTFGGSVRYTFFEFISPIYMQQRMEFLIRILEFVQLDIEAYILMILNLIQS